MTAPALLTEWARLLVDTLAQAGVRELVLSPGSRSTPFTWAALNCPALRCRTIIDERSAAFFALGMAKITGQPSALLCTSGSALAHYLPALIEASQTGTPLLAISADRPTELQGCDASQTIDQVKLFGTVVRSYVDLGTPDAEPAALRSLQRKVAQAVFVASSGFPGPVHLNAPARKPLEPRSSDEDPASRAVRAEVGRLIARGPTRAAVTSATWSEDAISELATRVRRANSGLVVCGPSPLWHPDYSAALRQFLELTGFALYCEATSQQRYGRVAGAQIDALPALLGCPSFLRRFEPDVVIEIGGPAVSGSWERFLAARPVLERHVVTPLHWGDPHNSASSIWHGTAASVLNALNDRLGSEPPARSAPFREQLAAANERAWREVSALLERTPDLTEAEVVRLTLDQLPAGALLVLGNSLPVREVDLYCPARPANVAVLSQRGASGIDGLISGAAGAALASGKPTVLLLGDVSFLHDLGGLLAARASRVPLAIVAINNNGGRIFEQLPLGEMAEAAPHLSAWTTPHDLELHRAGLFFGVAAHRIEHAGQFVEALHGALERPACTILEVCVGQHDGRDQLRALRERLEAAFAP